VGPRHVVLDLAEGGLDQLVHRAALGVEIEAPNRHGERRRSRVDGARSRR